MQIPRTPTQFSICFGAAVALMAACTSPPAAIAPAASSTEAAITAEDLRDRVAILAHDSMAGREPGTPGSDRAARYLADELARLGLEPGGEDGTFFQSVPLERRIMEATITLLGPTGHRALGVHEVLPIAGLGGLPPASRTEGSGSVVFAGHLLDPAIGSDELSLDQLRDAIVVVRLSPPSGVDSRAAPPRPMIASLFSPSSPAAAVFIVAEEAEEKFWTYASEVAHKGMLSLSGGSGTASDLGPPFFLISTRAVEELLGTDLTQARKPRTDLGRLQYTMRERVEAVEGHNVLAIIPGRDPARAGQYVTLGAHYDHVGVGKRIDGDSIYNGADDNASGTSALLEVAEALVALPPQERPARGVLFLWSTAEESGLLGSEYFTDHPTVPRDSMIAYINLDMVGRNHPDSLYTVGSTRLSSELGVLVESVNQRQPQPFVFDFEYDAPGHPEQIYCRSDHYNFARRGIPIVFFTSGFHDQYHAPDDEVGLIDHAKVGRVAALVRDLTLELSKRPEPLLLDQPVPPPGTPCS